MQALLEAADELLNGARLVAGGGKVGDELETLGAVGGVARVLGAGAVLHGWVAHAFQYTGEEAVRRAHRGVLSPRDRWSGRMRR